MQPRKPCLPHNEEELLQLCQSIAGLSFLQLSKLLGKPIPEQQNQRKGWAGLSIELALGAQSASLPQPDFYHLGIELKTIPVNQFGYPIESTFITSIPLLNQHMGSWETSVCFAKLKRILWFPVEGDQAIPFAQRRLGTAFLWSPSQHDMEILANDWQHLTFLVYSGRLHEIHAGLGRYLQIRPKAAHGGSLCYGYDEEGNRILTLPRGFYLRRALTKKIVEWHLEAQGIKR